MGENLSDVEEEFFDLGEGSAPGRPVGSVELIDEIFGDAFEREGDDRRYFDRFAAEGYAFGVNVIVYAMTH